MGSSAEDLKKWVQAWQRAGPELLAVKRQALRSLDTAASLAQLSGHFAHALRTAAPTRISGLVEQQRIFMKLRNAAGSKRM